MTSSLSLGVAIVAIVAALSPAISLAADPGGIGAMHVYVGTYTNNKESKGIYLFKMQADATGNTPGDATLSPMGLAAAVASPAFLEFDPKRRLIFAVNEVNSFDGKPAGGVSSFAIDPTTGALKLISQQNTVGTGPCHLVLDKRGKNILVANYGGGSVAVFPVSAEGQLSPASEFIQHTGSSVHPQRQASPHAHCVTLDPAGKFAYVCDLGLDKVMIYRLDSDQGKLTPADPPFAQIKPGAGPRHMAFGKDGKFAYVINELDSTITTFACDTQGGALKELQTISTLPEGFSVKSSTAEIAVHPSGKFVYGSNRGHDSIAIFSVDAEKGTLTYIENQPTGGKTPRHFSIDPSGKYILIANQGTGTVAVGRIDPETGKIALSATVARAASPVCAIFVGPQESRK